MDDLKISQEAFEAIESEIASETSVVGIDAKKTHILILHMLQEMNKRLNRIEQQLDSSKRD